MHEIVDRSSNRQLIPTFPDTGTGENENTVTAVVGRRLCARRLETVVGTDHHCDIVARRIDEVANVRVQNRIVTIHHAPMQIETFWQGYLSLAV